VIAPVCLARRAGELFKVKLTTAGDKPHGVTSFDSLWAGGLEFSAQLSDLTRNVRYGSPLVAV
jgi:hypothetical protein